MLFKCYINVNHKGLDAMSYIDENEIQISQPKINKTWKLWIFLVEKAGIY